MASPDQFQNRLSTLIDQFPNRRIIVVGDVIADQFVYGEIARISREAPVMILKYESTRTIPGGASNAASNVAALGANAYLVGIVGRDQPGRSLMLELRGRGVDTGGLVTVKDHITPTKVRILAGSVHSTRQQVIRIDREAPADLTNDRLELLLSRIREKAEWADAIIISDYGYGVINEQVVGLIREIADRRNIPVAVDSRYRLADLGGFTTATPNESEVEEIFRSRKGEWPGIERAGRELCEGIKLKALLITRGSQGMILFEPGKESQSIPIVGGRDVVDVTGAGDTVIATYTLALASGSSFAEAAHLANHAGGIVVMKRGTATVNREELLSSIKNH
ncbi:MAG TPA: PfkB family carbohydrate kinase [Blastocatellia bacterium]|nr:PfkB family carbohydrate kinase [Blastocatellia bacterium]